MALCHRSGQLAGALDGAVSQQTCEPVVKKMQKKLDESGSKGDGAAKPAETANPYTLADPSQFAKNMMRVGQQSQKLLTDFLKRQTTAGKEPVDPLNIAQPFMELMKAMTAHPQAVIDA